MNNDTDYMKIKHFIATMSIMVVIAMSFFGYVVACIDTIDRKVERSREEYASIEARLVEIQTDLVWLKQLFKEEILEKRE